MKVPELLEEVKKACNIHIRNISLDALLFKVEIEFTLKDGVALPIIDYPYLQPGEGKDYYMTGYVTEIKLTCTWIRNNKVIVREDTEKGDPITWVRFLLSPDA